MWKDFTSQRLPSNENPTYIGNGTDSTKPDALVPSSNPSLVSQITNTVWKGITNQSAMEIPPTPTSSNAHIPPHNPEPGVNPQTTSKMWSYAERLKGSNTIATLSKMSSNWRARALLSSSGESSQPTNIVSDGISHRHSKRSSNSYEQDSPRTSASFSTRSPDLPVETPTEDSSPQSSKTLLEKTRSLLSPRSPPPLSPKAAPKTAPKPLLLTSTLVTSGQSSLKSHRNLINSSTIPDPEEWADVLREKQHYVYRDSLSSTSSLSDRYVRTPKSTTSDRESDTNSSRIVSLNRRSVSPMAPNFRSPRERLQSRASSMSSGFTSPPTLPRSPLQENRKKTSARIASTSESPTILQTYPPLSDPNASRTTTTGPKESDDSDATSNERPPSVVRLTEAENAELAIQASQVRSKRFPRPPNLSIPDGHKPNTLVEEKTSNSSQLTVEWPQHEIEVDSTPRESRFELEDHAPKSRKLSRSPQALRKKLSTGELGHQRKVSVDTIRDYRQRKVSNGHRPRKISTESREIPKSKRDSSAEEGDDEGYDELLSAYESEDGPRSSLEY
jgi:hypothetical protein